MINGSLDSCESISVLGLWRTSDKTNASKVAICDTTVGGTKIYADRQLRSGHDKGGYSETAGKAEREANVEDEGAQQVPIVCARSSTCFGRGDESEVK